MNRLVAVASFLSLIITTVALALIWKVNDTTAVMYESLNVQIAQQSELLHRSLGTVIPITLPKDVDSDLKEVEKILSSKSTWPTTTREVENLNDKLADKLINLAPWVQEELLPRVLPRQWELRGLWLLSNNKSNINNTALDELYIQVDVLDELLSQIPNKASRELEQSLIELQEDLQKRVSNAEEKEAVVVAKEALYSNEGVEAALERMERFKGVPTVDALYVKLDAILKNQYLESQLQEIKKLLELAEEIESPAKEYTLERANQMLADTQINMGLIVVPNEIVSQLFVTNTQKSERITQAIIEQKHEKESSAIKQYQLWALKQMQEISNYEAVKAQEIDSIESMIDRNNPMSQARKDADKRVRVIMQNDLISKLGPIHQGYLEEPVNQLYQKKYNFNFKLLDDEQQLKVITEFVSTSKKRPE